MTDETLREPVAALKATVAEVRASLDHAADRDIPLLNGTVWAAIDAETDGSQTCPALSTLSPSDLRTTRSDSQPLSGDLPRLVISIRRRIRKPRRWQRCSHSR